MRDPAASIADFRRAVELLGEIDDPAATRTAETLKRWLAGEDFDAAADLVPTWRHHVQHKEHDAALHALLAMRPDLLARHIVAGVKRASIHRARPGGEAGYFHDLARAGFDMAERSCRRRLADIRGQCNGGVGHASTSPFPKLES